MFSWFKSKTPEDRWRGLPEGLRRQVEAALAPSAFAHTSRFLDQQGVLEELRVLTTNQQRRGAEPGSWEFVLLGMEGLAELMDRPAHPDAYARTLTAVDEALSLYVTVEPGRHNPAWSWIAASFPKNERPQEYTGVLDKGTAALRHDTDRSFEDAVGRPARTTLMRGDVRGNLIFNAVEFDFSQRLTSENYAQYLATLQLQRGSESLRSQLYETYRSLEGPIDIAIDTARLAASDLMFQLGQEALSKMALHVAISLFRAAAEAEPKHVLSRIELAQFLRDASRAGNDEASERTHRESVQYAREALDLLQSGTFILGIDRREGEMKTSERLRLAQTEKMLSEIARLADGSP